MKIAIVELIDIQTKLHEELKMITAKLQIVKSKTNDINKLASFQGKTATAAKAYFQSVHVNSLDELEQTINRLRKNYDKVLIEFANTIDNSSTAVITDDYLNQLNKNVVTIQNGILDTHEEGKQVIQNVSDIVPLPNPNITSFKKSVDTSQKYVTSVNKKLNEFDKSALKIIEDSQEAVGQIQSKIGVQTLNRLMGIHSYADQINLIQRNNNEINELSLDSEGDSKKQSKGIYLGAGLFLDFMTNIDSENYLKLPSQLYIHSKLDKKTRSLLKSKGTYLFTKEAYRMINNKLSFGMYKYNSKELMNLFKQHQTKALNKDTLKGLTQGWEPYGTERGKLAMSKEFDKLYGLDKYRELQKLTKLGKAKTAVTTFADEFVLNKVRATTEWKNPKVAFENTKQSVKSAITDFKAQNPLGKGAKIAGKGLGVLSLGIIVDQNIKDNKGDTQKIVVGTAVDTAFSAGAAATGAAFGSFIIPPIGTVAGAVVGVGVNALTNIGWGDPPKSVTDRTKDLVNSSVDTAQKACKEIGKKITGWFK
ncbi:T7SS effector LXG polymorphic toxin [Sporosarcina jiandibaonis]|uniref:T7SS effector LXG polymorphic toxin n=1 Tax=Sporosarcina jiandibaonis TaxID=2715535 RepID=UPI0015583211|nr:T7SS effector LXG polymorphic toxin [Sporosarcina jiandibaonis]